MSDKDQLQFISKALLMHQRPFLITKLDGDVMWVNNAAKYIFSMEEKDIKFDTISNNEYLKDKKKIVKLGILFEKIKK